MNIQRFDFTIDVLKVIPWMSDGSPNLRALLEEYQAWYSREHAQFWINWERDVFNLRTANDFGLNVWSIILNLPLYIEVESSPATYPAWGFGPYAANFGHGNFATDSAGAVSLNTEQKRQLLLLRMWQIVSSGSTPDINRALYDVFGGSVYALDGQDMSITYVFTEILPNSMFELIKNYDIIPRPSAVKAYYLVKPRNAFGFAPYGVNFDQPYSQFAS